MPRKWCQYGPARSYSSTSAGSVCETSCRAAAMKVSSSIPSSTRFPHRRSVSRSAARCSCTSSNTPKWMSASRDGRAPLDLDDRLLPGLEVELRRRAGGHDELAAARGGRPPHRPHRASRRRRGTRRGARHGPVSGSNSSPTTVSPTTWTFSDGMGASSPQSSSNASPYRRRALASSFDGSTRCGAPISETCTWSHGFCRTSTPAAPA